MAGAVLAAVGLLRPEAWFLAAGYWVWLVRGDGYERAAAVRSAALVALAPVVWVAMDFAVTGEPLFSFTHTRSAAEDFGRVVGVGGLVEHGPRVLGQELRPAVTVVALAGYAIALFVTRSRFLLAWTLATGAAFCIPVAAGTPLNARYLLPVIGLACVAAAGAVAGWMREDGRVRRGWAYGAAAAALLLIVTAPSQERRLRAERERIDSLADRRDDAREVLRPRPPCTPVATVHPLLTPLVALWSGVRVGDIVAPPAPVPRSGTYLWPTPAAIEGLAPPPPPASREGAGVYVVGREGGWTLLSRCAG